MNKAILLAALLLSAGLVVAPTASAGHCQIFRDPPQACYVVEAVAHSADDYLQCYQENSPKFWIERCL